MNRAQQLDAELDRERRTIRTDKVDVTWGQLATMYEDGELRIQPAYQRLFRWSLSQKTRFIESILLGLPLPALFVAEDENGVWELVDGLQRVSTVLEFMGVLRDANGRRLPPFQASFSSDPRLPALEGCTFDDLSLSARLWIKRASCRVEVIKTGSDPQMKFEVFERLNTGGSGLTEQEVRNCIFRSIDPNFADWVDRLAEYPAFRENLNLSDYQYQTMYDRALVLRFIALKNWHDEFRHDVEPFITKCFKEVLLKQRPFSIPKEERIFHDTFDIIAKALGSDAFRYIRDGRPRGGFSVYLFEALSIGVANNLDVLQQLDNQEVEQRLNRVKLSNEFLENTGPGANTPQKLLARITVATRIIRG